MELKIEEIYQYGLSLLSKSNEESDVQSLSLSSAVNALTTLHRLSLAIRRSSNREASRLPELRGWDSGYQVRHSTGTQSMSSSWDRNVEQTEFILTTQFENFVRQILTYRWMEDGDNTAMTASDRAYRSHLFERCIKSISVRRRQFQYFLNHQLRLESDRLTPDHPVPPGEAADTAAVANQNLDHFVANPKGDTRASTLDPQAFQAALGYTSGPSTSAPSSKALSSSNIRRPRKYFPVPEAPKLHVDEQEKTCPYCRLVLPSNTFSADNRFENWKKHVREDVQPYICLFKTCDQSDKSFSSFHSWQRHLQQPHGRGFECLINHSEEDDKFVYKTYQQLRNHIEVHHPDDPSTKFTEYQEVQQEVLPMWCFVCLRTFESELSLYEHVARHLRQAFLLALPAREEFEIDNIDSDQAAKSKTSGSASSDSTTNSQGSGADKGFARSLSRKDVDWDCGTDKDLLLQKFLSNQVDQSGEENFPSHNDIEHEFYPSHADMEAESQAAMMVSAEQRAMVLQTERERSVLDEIMTRADMLMRSAEANVREMKTLDENVEQPYLAVAKGTAEDTEDVTVPTGVAFTELDERSRRGEESGQLLPQHRLEPMFLEAGKSVPKPPRHPLDGTMDWFYWTQRIHSDENVIFSDKKMRNSIKEYQNYAALNKYTVPAMPDSETIHILATDHEARRWYLDKIRHKWDPTGSRVFTSLNLADDHDENLEDAWSSEGTQEADADDPSSAHKSTIQKSAKQADSEMKRERESERKREPK